MARGKKKTSGPKKKPGNKGIFFNSRLNYLNSHLDEFFECAIGGKTGDFFDEHLPEYWTMFPWKLARNVEPEDGQEFSSTDEEELELTQSQIMEFETENANILQNVQDTLASVQQAESRLLEISALQAELVTQLTRQTEQTEQLYEDAIATASMVEKGNVQLKEARRRARDSRKWILLFLIGASLSLLFLHYY